MARGSSLTGCSLLSIPPAYMGPGLVQFVHLVLFFSWREYPFCPSMAVCSMDHQRALTPPSFP
jgi:hypothetical protein